MPADVVDVIKIVLISLAFIVSCIAGLISIQASKSAEKANEIASKASKSAEEANEIASKASKSAEKANEIASKPFVTFYTLKSPNSIDDIGIFIENKGNGLAQLELIEMTISGFGIEEVLTFWEEGDFEKFKMAMNSLYNKIGQAHNLHPFVGNYGTVGQYYRILKGRKMKSGEKLLLLGAKKEDQWNETEGPWFREALKYISFKIIISSPFFPEKTDTLEIPPIPS